MNTDGASRLTDCGRCGRAWIRSCTAGRTRHRRRVRRLRWRRAIRGGAPSSVRREAPSVFIRVQKITHRASEGSYPERPTVYEYLWSSEQSSAIHHDRHCEAHSRKAHSRKAHRRNQSFILGRRLMKSPDEMSEKRSSGRVVALPSNLGLEVKSFEASDEIN